MSDFKAKMYQIQFRLRLRPRPRWGAYSAPPDPIAGLRGLLLREGRVGDGKWFEGKGRDGRGEEGRGREPTLHAPLIHISKYAPEIAGRVPQQTSATRHSQLRSVCSGRSMTQERSTNNLAVEENQQ